MKFFKVFIIVIIILVIVFLAIGYLQISFPGRWCDGRQAWQVCYREWLGAMAGYMALIVGVLTVLVIKAQIDSSIEENNKQIEASNTANKELIAFTREMAENKAKNEEKRKKEWAIKKYLAVLEIAMPVANSLHKNKDDFAKLFILFPELLFIEQDLQDDELSENIKEFNYKIGNYIGEFDMLKQGKLSKELYALKDEITKGLDDLKKT